MATDMFTWLMICGVYLYETPEIEFSIRQKNMKQTNKKY